MIFTFTTAQYVTFSSTMVSTLIQSLCFIRLQIRRVTTWRQGCMVSEPTEQKKQDRFLKSRSNVECLCKQVSKQTLLSFLDGEVRVQQRELRHWSWFWRQRFAQGHCTTQIKVALRCFNPVSPDSSKSLLLHTVIGRESYSGISSIFPYCFISLISCTRGRAAESQTSAEWHDTLMNSYWVRSENRNLACDPSIRWIDRKLQHVWTRTRHGEYTLSAQAEQSVVLSVGTIRWGSSTSSYFLLAVRWELPQSPLPISHFTVSLPWGACVRQQLIAFCGCL